MRVLLHALLLGTLLVLATAPAEAQFIHRNRDGTVSINPLLCFNDHQVRQAVAAQGFSNIYLNAAIESHQQVKASRNGRTYRIDFDICRGGIVSVTPLR